MAPEALVVSPEDAAINAFTRKDHFATTAAERWTFFRVTQPNSGIELNTVGVLDLPELRETRNLFHGDCVALASSRRCVDAGCTQLSFNNVAQRVYTWSTLRNAWLSTGPGSTGPPSGPNMPSQYRPVIGNGVKSLAHFSPDKVKKKKKKTKHEVQRPFLPIYFNISFFFAEGE
jgi:hypothetical protein